MDKALEAITLSNGFTFNYSSVTAGTYIEYNGIRLMELRKGYACGELEIKPELLNPNKILHGGVFSTLADTVAIFGCVYSYEVAAVTTISLTLSYLKSVKSGTISAAGTMLLQGKTISHWHVDIWNEKGQMLATALVSFSIMR
ncbi:MAG: PaaI family thioesterase [Spirochaetes bacterium]|nr:PaaI family thioesterase [Spirochaetota bacterium]